MTAVLITVWSALATVWTSLAWLGVIYLMSLGALCWGAPGLAQRFFGGFAATARLNALEGGLRLLFGIGLIGHAPASRMPGLLAMIGLFLAVTACLLISLYPLHRAYARWAVPLVQRHVRLIGTTAFPLAAGLAFLLMPL